MNQNSEIAVLDCETTGLNPIKDRILSLSVKIVPNDAPPHTFWCNPGTVRIHPDAQAIHGISNERAATFPPFESQVPKILDLLNGRIIGGFGIRHFDVLILSESFFRCGYEWPAPGTRILDAETIFKIRESRDLAAAVRFYCGRDPENHHDSAADAADAADVILKQSEKYGMNPSKMADSFSGGMIDIEGKFRISKTGVPVFNFSKHKDLPVGSQIGFLQWMLKQDFSRDTKRWAAAFLQNGGKIPE